MEIALLRNKIKRSLDNKYFALWMSRFDIPELNRYQNRAIFKAYWTKGTISCGKYKHLEGVENLFFLGYNTSSWDLYYEPAKIMFLNERGSAGIPAKAQVVDKEAVIGWCNDNRVSVKELCEYYINQMVEIELTLNTNISLQNMPFLITCPPDMKNKVKNLIDKLLNHEMVIFEDATTLEAIKTVLTEAPYVADKLRQLYYDYESQLLTILGIDNSHNDSTQDRMLLDAINANNVQINMANQGVNKNVQNFVDDINRVFNVKLTLVSNVEEAKSEYEEDTPTLPDNRNRGDNNETN